MNGTEQKVLATTAHLTYQQHETELQTGVNPRIGQCRAILEALSEKSVEQNLPCIFAGDLNDAIHPPIVFSKGGFKDTFETLGQAHTPTYPWGISTEDGNRPGCVG